MKHVVLKEQGKAIPEHADIGAGLTLLIISQGRQHHYRITTTVVTFNSEGFRTVGH